jgi:hypothetical protein
MQGNHFNHNPMRKILLPFVLLFALFSCQNKSEIENQITADLVGMLHNKAEVKELSIKEILKKDNQAQAVVFDCTLHFTDNLYKDDGTLAFGKGMEVKEKNNRFFYQEIGNTLKLIKLEFGEPINVTGMKRDN